MRWHPLFIKWCIYLRHLSGSAYDFLRETGCVALPSKRTLRDYTYYISAGIGFSDDVDKQLMSVADLREERNRNVLVVLDEVHIKEGLVYDKHQGSLIGFSNFGCQRQRGGTNENPTVQEFCRNTQALRVVNSVCGNIKKGNCRGQKDKMLVDIDEENRPLPKRQYPHK